MITFKDDEIQVAKVLDRYKRKNVMVMIPMKKGYLRRSSYNGFRVITKQLEDRHTSFQLVDLHEIRPDSRGNDLWSHTFKRQRMLLTRVFFRIHPSAPKDDANVIVDCVPKEDKCAGENPCRNGGTCAMNACKCKPFFDGEDCSENICPENICKNGATCVPAPIEPYYACRCGSNWSGQQCQTMFDFCFSGPCQNGGLCTPILGSYHCHCREGLSGKDCDVQLSVCAIKRPCRNGGACTSLEEKGSDGEEYVCECKERYTGPTCTVLRPLRLAMFHLNTGEGMALKSYPMKLVMQSRGSSPFKCFIDMQDNSYVEIQDKEFVTSAQRRDRLWKNQKFNVTGYRYRNGFYLREFSHMYVYPGSYHIHVKCTNGGYHTPLQVRPAVISPNANPNLCIPTVEIRNSGKARDSAPTYNRRDTLRLYAVTHSSCPKTKIDQVHWSVHRITEKQPYPTSSNHVELGDVSVNQHDLRVPSFTLSYGLWAVKIRADAYLESLGTVSAYKLGWFRIEPLPLRCKIAGGDMVSLPQDDMFFNATGSRDDDSRDGSIGMKQVTWRCWRFPSRQAEKFCLGPHRDLPGQYLSTLLAPGDQMTVRLQFVFEVTIVKSLHHYGPERNCSAQQTVDVMPKGSKRAVIICQYNCDGQANWQDKISFRGECPNCDGPFRVHWHVTSDGGGSAGSIINWREDTSFGPNDPHLIINAGVLSPAQSYHLSLKVAALGQNVEAGHAQMTLQLNGAPKPGRCWVNPTEGVSGVTFFSIGCANWTDAQLPLLYQFQEMRPDGQYYVIFEDINPVVENVTLTIGDAKHDYTSTVRVRITDAVGVMTKALLNVTVRPPVSVSESNVITYTKDVFKALPSGLDKIAQAIENGDLPTALQVVSASSSLLNQITDPDAAPNEVTEVETKRELRKQLFDSIADVPTPTLGTLQQSVDSLTAIAGGHRDEYFPEMAEKLINRTDWLAKKLLKDYADDPSVSPKLIEGACGSVVNTLSAALRVATEDVEAPSLEPVDLFYPNNERDYDVFDEKRIEHIEEKRRRVARVAGKYKSAADSVYETLGKRLEPGQKPKMLKSDEMSLWVQHLDRRTATNFTMAGLTGKAMALETDSNYAVLPNVADILDEHPDVKALELTVTALKRNPYWWDEESAKNVSTDLVSINVRGVPGYHDIKVGDMQGKIDIFLRRSSTDVVHVQGKAVLLDWYHTLHGRNNFPKDTDVTNHKIFVPPGGYSQVTQLIPIPQIVLVQDRRNLNITYQVPVRLFVNYLKDEKASINTMIDSFDQAERRLQWTLPKKLRKVMEREVDVFTIITTADRMRGIEEWYLGVMLHPQTSKRLLNDTVLTPIPDHGSPFGKPQTGAMEYKHDPDEILEYQYIMGEHILRAKEIHTRFVEDTENMQASRSADGLVTLTRGWLTPRSEVDGELAAGTPTSASTHYRDDLLNKLDRAVICTPNMTFHDCERHTHVKYNLTLFAGRCMYWSDNLTAFTDTGCEVGPLSTVDVLHCRCSHLTDFAGSFLVLPNRIDVAMVVDMNMLLSQNPTALYWMAVLLLVFGLLLTYAHKQDERDKKRRNIVYVDDNDPRHRYAYLVTVYTGVQYKAGTTAQVALVLCGEEGSSDTHLLTGEQKHRRTLERGSDSWFLIATEGSLGDLTELRVWHNNGGNNPEWFLDRVLVRDCQTDHVWVFLVGRWVHPVTGLLVTARPAALHEVTAWNTSVARRAEESLRDGHLWFSVFSRPLSSSFTRCQRLACAMTLLLANMLASLMFYGVPTGDASDQISRSQTFGLDWYDLVISAESALVVGLLVTPIIVLFRRSQPLDDDQRRTVVAEDEQDDAGAATSGAGGSKAVSQPTEGEPSEEITPTAAPADIAEMQGRVDGGAVPLRDQQPGCMLPWWCIYVAWVLSVLTMLLCGVLCLAYSAQFGALKCYIWLASSGVSLLQTALLIQPLIIVGASLLVTWCCQAAPEVENRSAERPAQAAVDASIAEEYAHAIHAKRTRPVYRQVPRRKLRKMRAKKMKDLLTHEAICDIATFLAYIGCLLVIIHGNKDPNAFYSTMTARNMFVDGHSVAGDDDAVTLEDAKNLGDVILYLNTTMIRTLHKAKEYNGKAAPRKGMTRQDGLYVIGVARLRQVRITREACRPPDQLFWMNFTACKNPFLLKYEDTGDYGQSWSSEPHRHEDPWDNEATEAWIHKDATYLQTMSMQGEHALYPGSGYTLHLGRLTKASQVVINYMEETKWLDAYTRALFVEFTMYNAESDMFNLVVLMFEQSRVGTITPSFDIKTSKLYVDTHMNRLTIFMTAFYVFFIIYNTVVEFRKMFRIGPRAYFRDMWSTLDLLLVVMGYVCVVLYVNRHIVLQQAFSNLRNTDENKFANFYAPVFWDYILTYAQAFALILTMAKFWKILTFNKRMMTFSLTLRYSRKELRAFFLFFAIAVIGYGFWSNGLFGASLEDYRNMWSSLISLILFSIGTFDYDSYVTTDRTFGIVFFVSYVFFVMIYLINTMLSIIMAGHEMAMDDMQHLVTKYDVVDVFIWEVRNFFEDSSSSSEDEGRLAAARTRQRRRMRRLLLRLFPWCLENKREHDLRRPVEQESLRQLQRFMSLTAAAGGVPPTGPQQDDGSVNSAEDAAQRDAVAGRRRLGMIEPEDVDDDEEAAPVQQDQPGHRFLLDEEDVAGGRRGQNQPRGSGPSRRRRRCSRTGRRHHGPPVPRRKSVQNDHRFLASLESQPEEKPPGVAVTQRSSSGQRQQTAGRKSSARRRSSGRHKPSERRRSSGKRKPSSQQRPPGQEGTSGQRKVSSGQRRPSSDQQRPVSTQRTSGGLLRSAPAPRTSGGATQRTSGGLRSAAQRTSGLRPAPAPRDPSQPSTSGLTRADLSRLAGRSTAATPQPQGSARPPLPS